MSNIINTYVAGGVEYMHPITILLFANLVIIGYIIYRRKTETAFNPNWLEAVKHFGGFALALGTFGTLAGLFMAFDALENSEQVIPFQVIMGGLKVALINVLYGLIVFFISMISYITLKLRQANQAGRVA
jgi:hypothetical protein